MAPNKRMILKADVNRIYDEEYSEQKIRQEKYFIRPSRKKRQKKPAGLRSEWE